jgi:hypothetical protein
MPAFLCKLPHRWLFRYVMIFLRDGTLPDDRALLSQLYREAVHWNLASMQRAIEEERVSAVLRVFPSGCAFLCVRCCPTSPLVMLGGHTFA